MTDRHPTLTQQIEAVKWALTHAVETGKRAHMRASEIMELRERLKAATETISMLEFGRETLK